MQKRRPKLGQHFLVSAGLRERILKQLACRPNDCWLEIGAGHGEMTALLAARSARVLAVEADPGLVVTLRERLAGAGNVEAIHADILKLSTDDVAVRATACKASKLRVYGNLPYAITSPILSRLFGWLSLLEDIFVVIQREVAERLVAAPGRRAYGYLSALAQFHTTPRILLRVPPGAFKPPPRVQSALVYLVPSGTAGGFSPREAGAFVGFLGLCFRQKRKTLFNNLRQAFPAARAREALEAGGHSERVRAEDLPVQALLDLHRRLAS